MTAVLVTHQFRARHGVALDAAAREAGLNLEVLTLPADPQARLNDSDVARIEIAFLSSDVLPEFGKSFFSAVHKAPQLKWLHVHIAGVDHPVYTAIMERGVRLTTSSGANAEPVAHAAIAGMLALAREFPRWLADQREHQWRPGRAPDLPRDLRGQTMLVYGLGKIGAEIARLAQAFGLRVMGVRRSLAPNPHIDEIHPPEKLAALAPRCDWLVLACPLTDETRGAITADIIAQLPRGAHVINISRGEVIDETALTAALASGHLAGAYLDVFAQEPLSADSALWDMKNVIVTPHNASASAGNDARSSAIFLDNLKRWAAGASLRNEVART